MRKKKGTAAGNTAAGTQSRERLQYYKGLQRRLYLTDERLRSMEEMTPNEARQTRFEDMQEKLEELQTREQEEYDQIMEALEQLKKGEEREVIQRRYIDGESWKMIASAIYGEEPDFDSNFKKYQKRLFKIHGRACHNLDRIWENEEVRA